MRPRVINEIRCHKVYEMDLLITQGEISSIWQVEKDRRATRLEFASFGERDLCTSSCFLRSIALPLELVEKILLWLFRLYLKTWNFDLCIDLLLFSRSFTGVLYRAIYQGCSNISFMRQYSRLCRTFYILENIYEDYLAVEGHLNYHCVKLTSMRSVGSKHQPWDFNHRVMVQPIVGNVVDLTDTQIQVRYGKCYGETVWLSGNYRRGVFKANVLKTPVINLMMVDVFDSLIHDTQGFNDHYFCFFRLLKRAFGERTALFVMVKEDADLDNPFITRSDLFLEI